MVAGNTAAVGKLAVLTDQFNRLDVVARPPETATLREKLEGLLGYSFVTA